MNSKEIKEILLTIGKTNLDSITTNKSDFEETINSIAVSDDIPLIKTPIMGTYYKSPSPKSSSFVRVGDKVNKGDTLCII